MWEATDAARVTAREVSRSSLIHKRGSITSESPCPVSPDDCWARWQIGVLTPEI